MQSDLIPRQLLFGNPDRVAPRLSPDCRKIAYLAPRDGVLNLWVRDVASGDEQPITNDRGRGIQGHDWAENGRHLLYIQDNGGDENWRLFSVEADGANVRDLTPLSGVQAQITGSSRHRPDELLISLNDRDPSFFDLHLIDLVSGERRLVQTNDIGAVGWVADNDLVPRVARVPQPDGSYLYLYRDSHEQEWRDLLHVPHGDAWSTNIVGFAGDDRRLHVISSVDAETAGLCELDPATGEMRRILDDPHADVAALMINPISHEIEAAALLGERLEWRALSDDVAGDLAALQGLHPGDLSVVSRDHDDAVWLVAYSQDRGPIVYFRWDRQEQAGVRLFSSRPALEDLPLAEMKPISYVARDGLTIHGYLTLPVGAEPRALPAVINVHGGPWHRDTWGFNTEAQWLANRGYACLQINFRGSTGYGKSFLAAGDREWGGKMQDDVTDAAQWLAEQGIADPARTGILGGSYGGYAVLSALTKTPELFACGIDLVGPSNLISFIKSIPPYWKPLEAEFKRRVGDLATEEDFLRERSPLFKVDRIVAPLMVVQGRNDPRVNREESLQIRDALQAAGKPVEFLEFDDEGHGFARPENRMTYYARAEAFMAKHLGGRAEPE